MKPLKLTLILIATLGLQTNIFAYERLEQRDFRSNVGDYNEYRTHGYDIQPPVPQNWVFEGCRPGDYDCMRREPWNAVRPRPLFEQPELLRDRR